MVKELMTKERLLQRINDVLGAAAAALLSKQGGRELCRQFEEAIAVVCTQDELRSEAIKLLFDLAEYRALIEFEPFAPVATKTRYLQIQCGRARSGIAVTIIADYRYDTSIVNHAMKEMVTSWLNDDDLGESLQDFRYFMDFAFLPPFCNQIAQAVRNALTTGYRVVPQHYLLACLEMLSNMIEIHLRAGDGGKALCAAPLYRVVAHAIVNGLDIMSIGYFAHSLRMIEATPENQTQALKLLEPLFPPDIPANEPAE